MTKHPPLDPKNANLGTERGDQALEYSLREYGAGRSILLDRHGTAIAGNKTRQKAEELGIPIRVVESDGSDLVAVQRTDLDLSSDPAARALAYADNRVGELDLAWDRDQLAADVAEGVDLAAFWTGDELPWVDLADDPGEIPPGGDSPAPAPAILPPVGSVWAIPTTHGTHTLIVGIPNGFHTWIEVVHQMGAAQREMGSAPHPPRRVVVLVDPDPALAAALVDAQDRRGIAILVEPDPVRAAPVLDFARTEMGLEPIQRYIRDDVKGETDDHERERTRKR
jgi:hypothetical protein